MQSNQSVLRRSLALRFLSVLAFILQPIGSPAQNDAATKLEAVGAGHALDSKSLKPWHLKISYLTFDASAMPAGDGTVEEWWAAPDRWRQEFTRDGKISVSVRVPEGVFYSKDFTSPPRAVTLMLAQVVHPLDEEDVRDSHPELREQQLGKAHLQCIMLSQPLKGVSSPPLGLFPTYCVDGDLLRLTWLFTNTNVITQQMGTFQGQHVAAKVQVSVLGKMVLEGKTDQLATFAPEDSLFSTAGMTQGPVGDVRLSSGVVAGHKIAGPVPVYPATARMNRVSGTVVMKARIGGDGSIRSLRVMSSPDGDLSLAALIAVQQWVYTPYLLNGVPTSVDTTITVNFNLASR